MNNQAHDEDFVDLRKQDSLEWSIPVLSGRNLGNPTLKMNMSIRDLVKKSIVYNSKTIDELGIEGDELDAQRPLYEAHAKSLAQYVVIGLVAMTIDRMKGDGEKVPEAVTKLQQAIGVSGYSMLQPVVGNIRHCRPDFSDLKPRAIKEIANGVEVPLDGVYRITLGSQHLISIVDGQHRVSAFELVLAWLAEVTGRRQYPVKGLFNPPDGVHDGSRLHPEILNFWERVQDVAFSESMISVECHLGATAKQEQQIFSDLNSKGKKVELSLALDYDESDAVNAFIKLDLLDPKRGVIRFPIQSTDSKDWHSDDGGLLRKELNPITCLALRGKISSKQFTPADVRKYGNLAKKFWEVVQGIPGFGEPKSRSKTVAAQPVVLKGLARLAYDLGRGPDIEQSKEDLGRLWAAIESGELDFSHKNEMWQSLMLNSAARAKAFPGIDKYVHVPAGTNLDAGTVDPDHGWVRYGSKHNDIYPRIGDLIRWRLKLNPRASVTRSIAKEKQS